MDEERKRSRSIYFWLVDLFSDAPFIKIVDANDTDEATVPSVAIKDGEMIGKPLEMGNREQYNIRIWFFDIYAKNKDQRADIAYRIFRALDQGIPVYDYDEGFPPDVTPTQTGAIVVKEKKYTPIDVNPELVEKLYWRGSITILEDLTN